MLDIADKLDNTAGATGELSADEYNDHKNEIQNAVESSGQALSDIKTPEQLGRAMFIYGTSAQSFQDSGSGNQIVLTPITGANGLIVPDDYASMDGMIVTFTKSTPTTSTSVTVNIGQTTGTLLGAKDVTGFPVGTQGYLKIRYSISGNEWEAVLDGEGVFVEKTGDTMTGPLAIDVGTADIALTLESSDTNIIIEMSDDTTTDARAIRRTGDLLELNPLAGNVNVGSTGFAADLLVYGNLETRAAATFIGAVDSLLILDSSTADVVINMEDPTTTDARAIRRTGNNIELNPFAGSVSIGSTSNAADLLVYGTSEMRGLITITSSVSSLLSLESSTADVIINMEDNTTTDGRAIRRTGDLLELNPIAGDVNIGSASNTADLLVYGFAEIRAKTTIKGSADTLLSVESSTGNVIIAMEDDTTTDGRAIRRTGDLLELNPIAGDVVVGGTGNAADLEVKGSITANGNPVAEYYTGTTATETDLPVGEIISVRAPSTTNISLNAQYTNVYYVTVAPANDYYQIGSGDGLMLGTWINRGYAGTDGTNRYWIFRRIS